MISLGHICDGRCTTSSSLHSMSPTPGILRAKWSYLAHSLFDITLHGTEKIKVRVVPSIVDFVNKEHRVPELTTFGFAAFLRFLKGSLQSDRRASGLPVPSDEQGLRIRDLWSRPETEGLANSVARAACADESLWGMKLDDIPGFQESVAMHLSRMEEVGVRTALSQMLFRGAIHSDTSAERRAE